MNKDYSVTFEPNEGLDDDMCETEESVKGRICRLFGFESRSLSMQEGDLNNAEIAGTRYYVYTSVRFTANGIGWSTDFEDLVREPVLDER
uniref:hypothetical protein n=1 Tax=Collinsella aerofaciens TaxID=74426 RepID=UPI00359CB62D